VSRGLTTPDGFWSRERLLGEYLKLTSLPADHLDLCLGLACLKLAVIMESIHYRYVSGKALDSLSGGLGNAAPALLQMGLMVAAGHSLAGLAA
jgi:aminoglycoside phosphotransferase (APT) family kinase protein